MSFIRKLEIKANAPFGLISWPRKDGFIKVKAEKKAGRWEVGGDKPNAVTDLGGIVYIVSQGKMYLLKGNRLIYQDEFDPEIVKEKA